MTPAGEPGPEAGLRVGVVAEQLRRQVPGGIGTYARGLLGALAAIGSAPGAGRELEVTVLRSRRPLEGGQDGGLALRGPRLPSALVSRLWDHGLLGFDGDYELLHAVSMAAPPTRRVLTAMVHDLGWRRVPDAYPPRGRSWHEAALTRIAARAAAVAVPSEKVAGELAAAGVGIGPRRIRVIAEGCDHLPPPDELGTSRLLAQLGVPDCFLLSVSTLEPRKNLARLLSAYASVRHRLPEPWPLLVVGPPGWGPALVPPEGAILVGSVSGGVLQGLYTRARALCYVPLDEGFGLPALEAMRVGVPVLASLAVPAATAAALQVDADDVDAIAEGLIVVACDDTERARLVALGRTKAEQNTWDAAARAHADWWHEVAHG